MTRHFKRTDRIAELLQRKLSVLIRQEVDDPRLPHFVTISGVEVSADLAYAKVYFTVLDEDVKKTADVLNAAAKHLRTVLARTVKLRTIPQLHFIFDESLVYGQKLAELITKISPPQDKGND